MSRRDTTTRGPFVQRSVSAGWTINHRWGTQGGDDWNVHVRRSKTQITLSGHDINDGGLTLTLDTARQLAAAISAAAEWEDSDG